MFQFEIMLTPTAPVIPIHQKCGLALRTMGRLGYGTQRCMYGESNSNAIFSQWHFAIDFNPFLLRHIVWGI